MKLKEDCAFIIEDGTEKFPIIFVLKWKKGYQLIYALMEDKQVGKEEPYKDAEFVFIPTLFIRSLAIEVEPG